MSSRTNFSRKAVRKNGLKFLGITGGAVAAAIALAGCTINIGTPGGSMMGGDSNNGMMGSSNSSEFSNTDVMFAQMMIPHHQQAVDMSDLALATSTNPDVLALAQKIKDAQAPEIELMRGWLDKAGANTTMGHGMDDMGMGGMMSDEEMAALKDATGSDFDTLYLQGMITHHEGALQMVKMIANSTNAEVKKLGEAITTSQSAEITLMKTMLTKVGA